MSTSNKPQRIPYGVSNFVDLRERNMYYVDKTRFIPMLEEQPDTLFFIRPRRFGKSLFLQMLCAYYDCNMKQRFNELFGDLWIGQHPTEGMGQYQVLFLDFSQVSGDINRLEEDFNDYCCVKFDGFMRKYASYYSENTVKAVYATKNARQKLNAITDEALSVGHKLFLVIDEYDNFTNTVLNELGEAVYHSITHASGFYRDFFKKFKGTFNRILMMGVSPVTLDDVTSGFNIGWNITTNCKFNDLLGFNTNDVRALFGYYKEQGKLPADCDIEAVIEDMKPWYDNYCFSKEALARDTRMFNCDMVLYFLRFYIDSGCPPRDMVDPNTKTDYNKMKRLLQLDHLDGDRKGVLKKIAEEGQVVADLITSFPATDLVKPEMFTSLLFYYGMLTIKGTFGDLYVLGIPNNNVRKQYYHYLTEMYNIGSDARFSDAALLLSRMALEGKWQDALTFIAQAYENNSAVRSGIEGERNLQGFMTAYLSLFNYYYVAPELELAHGYCDFFLLPDLTHYDTHHSYIIELKYLPSSTYAQKHEAQWGEAVGQIRRYARAPRVEALRQGSQLHCIVMQFEGWTLRHMEEVETIQ